MRFKKSTRIAAAVAVIGAVAAGGAAFTASNTVPTSVAGIGSNTVSGGTVVSLSYTLSSDGTDIDTANVIFSGDTTADAAEIGFDNGTMFTCGAGSVDANSNTSYTCDLTGTPVPTSSTSSAQVALVSNQASGT